MGEEHNAAGGDRERCGERSADAMAADDVAGSVRADSGRECERDERQTGRERPHAEHVLKIERAEQEEAEDRAGRGEHQEDAAADSTVRKPLDAHERCVGVSLDDGERGEPGERRRDRSSSVWQRRPAGALALA